MSLPYVTCGQFVAARDNGEITKAFAPYDGLDYKKLCRVLGFSPLYRYIAVKRWFKYIGKLCDIPIAVKMSAKSAPYMTESGEVGLKRGDFFRPDYLFFATAHETAHFLLMKDEGYEVLKELDGQYEGSDKKMMSPVEYCANVITIGLFDGCISALDSKKKRERIERASGQLREQIKAK